MEPLRGAGCAAALCFAFAGLLAPAPAHSAKSHLLQKPERHVVLTSKFSSGAGSCWDDRVLVEVLPDGSAATEAFVVPEGQVLVVLDVDWRTVASPTTFLQGRVHVFGIRLGGAPHPDVFRSGVLIDANLSAASFWQGSAALAAGFEVHPGVEICPHASAEASLSSAVNTVTGLTLRGYLVKAK